MGDLLAELFDHFDQEEQARIGAAEASTAEILAQGTAAVTNRRRIAESLHDGYWLLQPENDARVDSAGVVFTAYVNALWRKTDAARSDCIPDFLAKVEELIEPVLMKYGWEGKDLIAELRGECQINASQVHSMLHASPASTTPSTEDQAASPSQDGTDHVSGRSEAAGAAEQSEMERGQSGVADRPVISAQPPAILEFSDSWRKRKRRNADLQAAYARQSGRNLHNVQRQEDLLKDARVWAKAELRKAASELRDVLELKEQVVKLAWDKFVPMHRYHSDFDLGYREFVSALWEEEWPSLEDCALEALVKLADSAGGQAAVVTGFSADGRAEDRARLAAISFQGIAEGAMPTEFWESLRQGFAQLRSECAIDPPVAPAGCLTAIWTAVPEPGHWRLYYHKGRDGNGVERRFTWHAQSGAAQLGFVGDDDAALAFWLDGIRRDAPEQYLNRINVATGPGGADQLFSVEILDICGLSADYCRKCEADQIRSRAASRPPASEPTEGIAKGAMPDNLFSEAEINAQIKATDKSEVGISWDWARGLIDLSAPEAADAESPPQLMNEIATRFRDALANGAAAPRPVNRLIVRLPLTDHVDDVRVPKMTHEFPAAFSQSARAKVMAARLRAEEALGEKKHSILDFDDAEALLLELVLQVFMAFAEEACAVGIQMAMTAGDVERECLRFLKGYAAQAGLMDEWPAPIGDTEISDGLRRRIEVSDEWKTYRQLLQNLAEAQADRQPAANSMEPSPVKEINGEVDGERQPTDARMASPTPNSAAPAREPSTELSAEIVKSLQGATVSLNSIRSALAPTEWAALAAVLEAEAARIAKVDEAMESAIPLTPRNSDEMIELLIRFSTDPKGLGLTAEQFGGLESGSQWLEHYHAWERTRRSAIRAKGQGGRPPKDQTREIHAEWVRIGKPKRTAAICDRIARSFFASELKGIHRGSPEHRRVRERVRKAIERIERRSAT